MLTIYNFAAKTIRMKLALQNDCAIAFSPTPSRPQDAPPEIMLAHGAQISTHQQAWKSDVRRPTPSSISAFAIYCMHAHKVHA